MRISILLATFNGEKYLKEQLDSLFSQTYMDFEIITRDDYSCDQTKEILKSYNIKVFKSLTNKCFYHSSMCPISMMIR